MLYPLGGGARLQACIARPPKEGEALASEVRSLGLHRSDSPYFLHFPGSATRKALLLFTRVIRADEYIMMNGEPNYYY